MSLNSVNFLGVPIVSTSIDEVLREIAKFVASQAQKSPLVIFTPNPEFLVEASRNDNFRNLLNKSDINLPDGIGLVWASRILGKPIKERISGADVVERLLKEGNESGRREVGSGKELTRKWTVGIAGARRGVQEEADDLIKRLQKKYPNITFVNLDDTNFKSNLKDRILNVKNDSKFNVQDSRFNVIFACYGMEKQEKWIMENKDKIKANVFMGIGGSLDFITGFTKRAPLLIRKMGLEWLWRGLQRPKHFKRIWKAVFVFGWLVIKEKFVSARSLLAE